MRSTPGNSFGPMAISATTAMTTSSLHPMSNMKNSAHARQSHQSLRARLALQTRLDLANKIWGRPRLPQPVLLRVALKGLVVQTALLPTSDRAAAGGVAL